MPARVEPAWIEIAKEEIRWRDIATSRMGRVCQVVEKSERVIIPVMIATYYAARFTDPISFQPSIFRSFT